MHERVDVGFVEECEPWRLDSRFFPSKIGGKPAWLDLQNIPGKKEVECDYCHEPCIFLLQVYAPYEDDSRAFHRTIYIFICRNSNCCKPNSNANIKILRSQLERINEFYSSDPPIEDKDWRPDLRVEKWKKICRVCGILAPSHCAKCKKVNYCSKEHQVRDWKENHKEACSSDLSFEDSNILFPQYELITDAEDYSIQKDKDYAKLEKQEMKKYEQLVKSGQAGSLQTEKDIDKDLVSMACNLEDQTFLQFQARIKHDPDQVLRYARDGEPLFISSKNKPQSVPNCEECGGPRKFEFQVMPQLLNYLDFDNLVDSIDWGILIVYTCRSSCVPKSKYAKEYVWKQDVSNDKVSETDNEDDDDDDDE